MSKREQVRRISSFSNLPNNNKPCQTTHPINQPTDINHANTAFKISKVISFTHQRAPSTSSIRTVRRGEARYRVSAARPRKAQARVVVFRINKQHPQGPRTSLSRSRRERERRGGTQGRQSPIPEGGLVLLLLFV